jgi:serine/threonine protein kinase
MATSSNHDYYTAPVGEPLKSSDAAGLHANVKSNKKQVSFHRDEKLVAVSHSHRSIDSDASKDSSKDHSPASSCRSYGSTGYTTVSLPSLHESLVRTQRHRDPYRYYEVIKVLGDGSMGSVSKVKKRKSAIGGSARRTFVEEESRHHRATQENTFLYRCFSFCIPGMAEKDKEDAFVSTYDHGHSNGTGNGSGGSHESSGATSAVSALTGDSSSRYYETTNGNGTTDTTYDTNSQRKATKKRYKKASSIISYTGEKNVVYALKTIILERVKDATFRKELLNEITILRSIDHPNIVRAIETYDYHHRLYLVLELCSGGDLYARDPYDEQQAKAIVYMILDAVAYLHSKDLVHRDLKYENIVSHSR